MDGETKRGVERLRTIFEANQFRLDQPQEMNGGFSFYFVVRGLGKSWDFSLSREALDDLSTMPQYQRSAATLAQGLQSRFKNVSPTLFFSATSRLLNIEVQWPLESYLGRFQSFARVTLEDYFSKESARCAVVVTDQQSTFDLKEDPFRIHPALVNSIRRDVDQGKVTFYSTHTAHPNTLQEIKLSSAAQAPTGISPDQYLRAKVFWLGFNAGNEDTLVWIADPWDADYLGKSVPELRRHAQTLKAHGYLRLDESREFASVDTPLLREMAPLPIADQDEVTDRDPLLGIYHRGRFDRDLEALLHAAPETQIRSVVMLDLDDFKKVNDTFGHEAGDRVLKQAASVLKSVCEGKGHPYRYDGDEFAILLPNFASEEARALAERVRAEIYALHFDGRPEKITISLGVATYPETTQDFAKLVSGADTALYTAKNAGRNRVCVAGTSGSSGSALSAGERSKPSDDIEEGIDLEELSVSITQGIAEPFIILVKNESDVDVIIRKLVLKSKGIRLTDPVLPPSRDAWKIPAHGRLPIEFKAAPDPTLKLQAIYDRHFWNPPDNMIPKAEIEFSFHCEVQGKAAKQASRMLVYVDSNRRIWEL